mmetsp:Transcript_28618/g.59839  ORF Transcript_28618/g.59839 Transcript_28618/m.59839 type:complete len:148 (-) Transcript_28618:1181-1624(-)
MSFRLQARNFFLTYPHIGAAKPELHEFLNHKLKMDVNVKICHEHHADGDIHTHCCAECPKKPDVKNARYFDYEEHHCNITVPKTIDHWRNQVKYVEKEDADVYGEITVAKTKDEEFTEACEFVKALPTPRQSPYRRMPQQHGTCPGG